MKTWNSKRFPRPAQVSLLTVVRKLPIQPFSQSAQFHLHAAMVKMARADSLPMGSVQAIQLRTTAKELLGSGVNLMAQHQKEEEEEANWDITPEEQKDEKHKRNTRRKQPTLERKQVSSADDYQSLKSTSLTT